MLNIKKILKGLRILNENDQTKAVEIAVANTATTNTKTTISVSQTANRTLAIPASGTELVTDTATQTLTNKTIVAANNTVTTAPSGNLVATELNSALAELQADVDTRATTTQLNDHINDATDAHAASAITNTPAGDVTSTTVQDAINELQTDINTRATVTQLNDHINDTSGAHSASAITNVPSGNLLATDVQAALNEIQTEIDNLIISGGGASTSLNNLIATSINQDLIPQASKSLGSVGNPWSNLVTSAATVNTANFGGGLVIIGSNTTQPDGVTTTSNVASNGSQSLYLSTANQVAFVTRDVRIQTGNTTSTSNSGNIVLRTGTVDTGVRGTINLVDASLATAAIGNVWKLTNTSTGAGQWSPVVKFAESAAAPNFGTTSTSYVDVTNLSVAFTTSGGLLEFGLNGTTTQTRMDLVAVGSTDTLFGDLQLVNVTAGNTVMAASRVGTRFQNPSSNHLVNHSPGCFRHFVTLAAGTYTVKLQIKSQNTSVSFVLDQVKLFVKEI